MKMWHMRNSCWIIKIISTHSEYVILITFPVQQCLYQRRWILGLYVYYRSILMFLVTEILKISLLLEPGKLIVPFTKYLQAIPF